MARVWTEAQRQEKAEQVRRYWREHGHPSKGRTHSSTTREKMNKPKNRGPVKGKCFLCGRALYAEDSVRRGMGPVCSGEH